MNPETIKTYVEFLKSLGLEINETPIEIFERSEDTEDTMMKLVFEVKTDVNKLVGILDSKSDHGDGAPIWTVESPMKIGQAWEDQNKIMNYEYFIKGGIGFTKYLSLKKSAEPLITISHMDWED